MLLSANLPVVKGLAQADSQMANLDDAIRETVRRLVTEKDGTNHHGNPAVTKISKAVALSVPWASMYLKGKRDIPVDRIEPIAGYFGLTPLEFLHLALGGLSAPDTLFHGTISPASPSKKAGAHVRQPSGARTTLDLPEHHKAALVRSVATGLEQALDEIASAAARARVLVRSTLGEAQVASPPRPQSSKRKRRGGHH